MYCKALSSEFISVMALHDIALTCDDEYNITR